MPAISCRSALGTNNTGSHHIYRHEDYEKIVSLPGLHGGTVLKRIYCRQAMEAIVEVEDYGQE